MRVSNFFSPVLFILSFSLPPILPDPHCLSGLSLSLSLSSSAFAFLQGLSCTHLHQPSPFHPNCSFLCTLQLCGSAFGRWEYLQLCMFETSGGREIFITLYMFVLACAGITFMTVYVGECKHMDFFVYECVCICICVCVCLCRIILIILTSQCPILGKREARVGGGRG